MSCTRTTPPSPAGHCCAEAGGDHTGAGRGCGEKTARRPQAEAAAGPAPHHTFQPHETKTVGKAHKTTSQSRFLAPSPVIASSIWRPWSSIALWGIWGLSQSEGLGNKYPQNIRSWKQRFHFYVLFAHYISGDPARGRLTQKPTRASHVSRCRGKDPITPKVFCQPCNVAPAPGVRGHLVTAPRSPRGWTGEGLSHLLSERLHLPLAAHRSPEVTLVWALGPT